MNSQHPDDTRIKTEAFRWLVEITDPGCPEPSALPPGFSDWLSSSERHQAAFIEAVRISRRLNDVDPQHRIDVGRILRVALSAVVVPFPIRRTDSAHRTPEGDRGRRPQGRRWRWAACASLLVVLAVPYGLEVLHAAPVTYQAGVGQRIFVPLEDGSTVELNTRTRIEVRYRDHSREVRLVSGEAYFDVKHDPDRPFRVVSGATAVQDVGTRFVVWRRVDGTTTVTVLEGQVEVRTRDRNETLTLNADEVGTVKGLGRTATIELGRLARQEIERRVSWQTGILVFQGQTLAEAVGEVNRYNARQLVIADPSISTLKIGGTCRGVDLESFVALLRVLFDVRAVPSPDDANVIELKRNRPRAGL